MCSMTCASNIPSKDPGRAWSLAPSSVGVIAMAPLARATATESELWSTPTDPGAKVLRLRPMPQPTSIVRPSPWRRRFHWYGACTRKSFFHQMFCFASNRWAYSTPSVPSAPDASPIKALHEIGARRSRPAQGSPDCS
jgi:hypothetical protein